MLNNNFRQLVRKYERYSRSRFKRIVLSILALLALLAIGFFAVFKSDAIVNSFKKTHPEPETMKSSVTTQPVTTKKIIENEPKVKKEIVVDKTPKRVEVDTPKEKNLPNKVYKRDTTKTNDQSQFKLKVSERKNLYKLLTDHKEKDTYQSAVTLAQFYADEKNLDKTIEWAVKASKKDPKQSTPWMLYAKSKAKQGKTAVAKKALSIYLKHTKSVEVQDLLDSL